MMKAMLRSERPAQALLVLLTFGFLVSALVYLYGGRWLVTQQDYWVIYETCLNHSWLEGALTKINHQPIVFPSLIWWADLHFAHGNQELLFFVGLTLLSGTALLLLWPFWRDPDMGLTAKLEASLIGLLATFWMARASITTSGGFTCICALALGGAVAAYLALPGTRLETRPFLRSHFPVIAFAFLASFSFGTGLAIWPTLLVLGWGMRSSWRSLAFIAAGGIAAAVIYTLLPAMQSPLEPTALNVSPVANAGPMLRQLCLLLGAPILHATAAWTSPALSAEDLRSSMFSTVAGAAGLVGAVVMIGRVVWCRDLSERRNRVCTLGLVLFILFAMGMIILGRTGRFHSQPTQLASPRYLFWSTLFWTGLVFAFIQAASTRRALWWPALALTLALPILAFPLHYQEGLLRRHAQSLSHAAATSLLNGVRDEEQTHILFRKPEQIYRFASQLRAARLDIFASGLQDWIGRSAASLFDGKQRAQGFRADCEVKALIRRTDAPLSAKVSGWSLTNGNRIPGTLVFVDDSGMVRGVGRSWFTNKLLNRLFYGGKFTQNNFVGYITEYDPARKYFVRSADQESLSSEKSPVKAP